MHSCTSLYKNLEALEPQWPNITRNKHQTTYQTKMTGFETIIGPFIPSFTIPRSESMHSTLSQSHHWHTLIIHCDNPAYIQQNDLFRDFHLGLCSETTDDSYMQHYLLLKRASELERSSHFLERLREIVLHDGRRYPAIEAIYLVDANGSEGPLWTALEGLKPKHLTICCGVVGYVNCSGLSRLKPPWLLESLTIVKGTSMPFPASVGSIHALTLFRCQNILYKPDPGGSRSSLTHLSLRECSGGANFVAMCSVNPDLPKRLKTLYLESPQLDFFESQDLQPYEFKMTLRHCTALSSLTLLLGETTFSFRSKCMGLPAFFPKNLEHLEIRGPPGMASDLWLWRAHIEEPGWLINLNRIRLRFESFDRRGWYDGGDIEAAQVELAALEVEELIAFLRTRRPDVVIEHLSQ